MFFGAKKPLAPGFNRSIFLLILALFSACFYPESLTYYFSTQRHNILVGFSPGVLLFAWKAARSGVISFRERGHSSLLFDRP